MNAALQDARKTPPVLGGLLITIVVLLLVSIGLQAGVVNPTAQSTQSEVRQIACAQAESTANAFRFRQVGPNGKLESREHFLTRMLAQRHTLLIASGTGCDSAPGFPPFDVQVARALREINEILGYRQSKAVATDPQLQANSKSVQDMDNGSDGGDAPASDGTGGAPAPVNPDSDDAPAPHDPSSDPAPAPPKGDNAAPSPSPTASSPAPSPSPGGSTASNPPPVVTQPTSPAPATDSPGLIETTVEKVDDAITPTVCAVSELLRGTCP